MTKVVQFDFAFIIEIPLLLLEVGVHWGLNLTSLNKTYNFLAKIKEQSLILCLYLQVLMTC